MPRGVEYRSCPRSWPTALAVLAVVLLAPAAARAGCGDHVLVRPGTDASPSTPAPARKHVPCSGPHCTRSPVAPLPAPSAPTAPEVREWACVLTAPPPPAPTIAPHPPGDPFGHPLAAGSTIYHPPR